MIVRCRARAVQRWSSGSAGSRSECCWLDAFGGCGCEGDTGPDAHQRLHSRSVDRQTV